MRPSSHNTALRRVDVAAHCRVQNLTGQARIGPDPLPCDVSLASQEAGILQLQHVRSSWITLLRGRGEYRQLLGGRYPGRGIAFLPRFLVAEDIAAKRLALVLTGYVSTRLPLYVMFPKGHYVLAKVKALVAFLTAAINDKPGAEAGAPRVAGR
jgi:DNA-binding transcriptional LysR family regulator